MSAAVFCCIVHSGFKIRFERRKSLSCVVLNRSYARGSRLLLQFRTIYTIMFSPKTRDFSACTVNKYFIMAIKREFNPIAPDPKK